MQRGKKPKPASVKALHGTQRPDRQKAEPQPPAGDLVPSPQIGSIQYARGFWDHYVATAPLGMLKPVDVPLLERLCVALALAHQAMDDVAKRGLIVKAGKAKVQMQNPYLPVVNRQTEIARKLASELGLPVTARARLDAPDVPTPPGNSDEPNQPAARRGDALDQFLDQRPGRTLN
jgi:P27 family predicted phage terminase small subunit